MKAGVIVFPGSNCDHDVYHVFRHVLGQEVEFLWHQEEDLASCDLVVLPGGFSYGDYLRSGALAALSPVMAAVQRHAERGGLVLGICNGFQILLEAGLLPGALVPNRSLRFECRDVWLRVERTDLPFTSGYKDRDVVRIPVAHMDGNFQASASTLDDLEDSNQVVFRYVDESGAVSSAANPNGSARNIAGLTNAEGNVLGMMPHPERCVEELLGNTDGLALFSGLIRETVGILQQEVAS
ncbi:MAG: phosphoribosylformylglycinamidine synthase subunit PurQ [Deltaproteobacteria bacterium]|nr:phosphoribosylformylglycinamidine synthase subunit PurQ [Deltaproteobacteria bacterium]